MTAVFRKERFWHIYLIFWVVLAVPLAVSIHLGLNSTFVWYTDRTSYKMYEAMFASGLILLGIVLITGHLRFKRHLTKEELLKKRLAILGEPEATSIGSSELSAQIEESKTRKSKSWLVSTPMILMTVLLVACSVFAIATIHTFLAEDFRINTILILFSGSVSKIVIGLATVVLYKFATS